MNTVFIQRQLSDDQGTLGLMSLPSGRIWWLELPERNNSAGKSCIPAGRYLVRWTKSPRLKKYTYEVTGVPGRAGIRLHSGNFAGDVDKGYISHSLGCPLPGLKVGTINGQRAVLNSRSAIARLETAMGNQDFILEIKNA